MLEDDDRDIRRRTAAVNRSILGQDMNDCEDKPVDEVDSEDGMRITVLGDINGNEAIEMLSQQHQQMQHGGTPASGGATPQPSPGPMPQQSAKTWKDAILPFILGAAIAGPIGGWAGYSWQAIDNTTINAPGTNLVSQPPAFGLDGSKAVKDGS